MGLEVCVWVWVGGTSLDQNLKRLQDFYLVPDGKGVSFSPSLGIIKINS